ncbi:hypothetical protein HNP38_000415 [Chryseobacterium defluvii]|uniref:Uncharacterized protein n=1 Tax=Chryseobacterium defluvii TaxID=160396 RepID=A0A840KC87_9FLAO|nr:hypothetical protein [Chryseobacterium defluvii]MBB4805143.1 hypothetical protein [Chryseobacterium defluvii]
MKKLLYSFLIFASASLFAQKNPATKFAVADNVVGTVDMFKGKKDIIQSMSLYKAANLPQNLKKFSYLAENGITEFKIKKGEVLDRISLAQLNEQQSLAKNTPVFIDGYEFTDTETKVYGDMLNHIEVKDYNGKKSLFISTQVKSIQK